MVNTAAQQWRAQMSRVGMGLLAVVAGIASIYMYKSHRNQFMVASAVFTMVYTVLALFVAIRGRSVWSGGSGAWFKALEMLSYLQCFNSVFMFVCIMHVTGALQFAMRSRARPQYNYPQ